MGRRVVAYVVSPPLFAVGHVCSRCCPWWAPGFVAVPLGWCYQKVMSASYEIEEWAGVEVMWLSPPR